MKPVVEHLQLRKVSYIMSSVIMKQLVFVPRSQSRAGKLW